jgi:signal transduction histidine kinase
MNRLDGQTQGTDHLMTLVSRESMVVPSCPLDGEVRAVVLLDDEERIVYLNPPAKEALARIGVENPRTLWDLPAQLQPALRANRPPSGGTPKMKELVDGLWGVYLPVQELDPDWVRGLLEAEQMAAVGQLAARVAQEIGGPNTSIQVAVDHLLEGGATEETEKEKALLQVLSQTERITRLTRQLIALADPGRPQLTCLDINETVESACELMEGSFSDLGIHLEADFRAGPVRATADPNHLLQALVNLLLNARTALQDWDEDRKVRVRTEANADRVYLHIEDSGPGIPPEDASRIFLPFVSTTGGTGMGLFLTRQILVEQRGGIRIQSPNEMGGATFTLYLEKSEESSDD